MTHYTVWIIVFWSNNIAPSPLRMSISTDPHVSPWARARRPRKARSSPPPIFLPTPLLLKAWQVRLGEISLQWINLGQTSLVTPILCSGHAAAAALATAPGWDWPLLLLPCLACCWVLGGRQWSRQRCQPYVGTHETSCLEKCTPLHRYVSTTTNASKSPPPPSDHHHPHITTSRCTSRPT